MSKPIATQYRFPIYGWLGVSLIVIFWYLNWSLNGLRTHWGFFPLWLGYCLCVDALTYYRKASSLLTRNWKFYFGLFFISSPIWWLFELINEHTQYWVYTSREQFTDLEYFLFASLSFSTVVPAVFGTSELISSLGWVRKFMNGPRFGGRKSTQILFHLAGWALLVYTLLLPSYSYAFIWMAIYFILDPVNYWTKQPAIIKFTGHGDWRQLISLWTGCLVCGFFWEMWNYHSLPKWIYKVPGVDFWHVFEMPLLGYLGYFPFALELYVLYHFIIYVFPFLGSKNYLEFS